MNTKIKTYAEYMADENCVTPAQQEQINFEIELIGKMIEAREANRIQKYLIDIKK